MKVFKWKKQLAKARRIIKDIDLISLNNERRRLKEFLLNLEYKSVLNSPATSFIINTFYDDKTRIDISYNSLYYCHEIDLRNSELREIHTINLSDLLLSKLQIVNMTQVDFLDNIVLLKRIFGLSDDKYWVEINRIIALLSSNWGFGETVKNNLKLLYGNKNPSMNNILDESHLYKLEDLIIAIQESKKSLSWKLRNLIGHRIKWYNEIS